MNLFNNVALKQRKTSRLCDNDKCKKANIEETLTHFIFECERYNEYRKIMIKDVKMLYEKNNKIEESKITFNKNDDGRELLRKIILPSFKIKESIRISIIKQIIQYVINTGRFKRTLH